MKREMQTSGITLIALVVTIIILIILATISVNILFGDGGLINRSQRSGEEYRISQAREELTLALGSAGMDKKMDPKYNQDDYLDGVILKEIPDGKILDDVVIVDGYAFEIDRSVPKIGKYVGKESELVFPELQLEKVVPEDKQTATIKITAKEETNGISKIEIIQEGIAIKTYTYDNVKEEITEDYEVTRNGKYIVKVHSALRVTGMVEITELIPSIEYSPLGDTEYKREHSVQIGVKEAGDKVVSIKYQWLNTIEEPDESTFTESCNRGATLTKNEVTGKWYLWTLVETKSGFKRIERSEAFYFDNTGPTVTLMSNPTSETAFTLTAEATDEHSKIAKYEFYVNDKLEKTIQTNEGKVNCNISVEQMNYYESYVIVEDTSKNITKKTLKSRTKMYVWDTFSVDRTKKYIELPTQNTTKVLRRKSKYNYYKTVKFSNASGYQGVAGSSISSEGSNCQLWEPGTDTYWTWRVLVSNTEYWVRTGFVGSEFKNNDGYFTFNVQVHKCQYDAGPRQGSTLNKPIYSPQLLDYPLNGEKDNIWYVKRSTLG